MVFVRKPRFASVICTLALESEQQGCIIWALCTRDVLCNFTQMACLIFRLKFSLHTWWKTMISEVVYLQDTVA